MGISFAESKVADVNTEEKPSSAYSDPTTLLDSQIRKLFDRFKNERGKLSRGQVVEISQQMQELLNQAKELKDNFLIAEAYSGLATAYWELHRFSDAEQAILRAKEHQLKVADDIELASILSNLSRIQHRKADFQGALNSLRWVLRIYQRYEYKGGLPYVESNLSRNYRDLGDMPRAIRSIKAAITLFEETGDMFGQIRSDIELGRLYRLDNDLNKAEQQFKAVRDFIDQQEDRSKGQSFLSTILNEQSRVAIAREDLITAHSLATQSLGSYSQSISDSNQFASKEHIEAMLLLAEIALIKSQTTAQTDAQQEFKHHTNELVQRFDKLEDMAMHRVQRLELARLKLDFYYWQKDIEQGKRVAESARQVIAQISSKLDPVYLGPRWTSTARSIFDRHVRLCLQEIDELKASKVAANKLDKAWNGLFSLIESNRAQNFVRQRRNIESVASHHDGLLIKRLSVLERRLISATTSDEKQRYQQSIDELRERLQFQKEVPLHHVEQTIERSAIQLKLGSNQAYLSYHVYDQGVLLFALTPKSWIQQRLALTPKQLRTSIGELLVLTKRRSPSVIARLENTAELVPTDWLHEQGVQELVIAADDVLHALPFAELDLHLEDGRYEPLIKRYSLVNVLSVFDYLDHEIGDKADQTPDNQADIAIFTDPAFDSSKMIAVNTLPANEMVVRSWSDSLARLPGSAREANSIKQKFSHRQVYVVSQDQATSAMLMSDTMRQSKVLHIASHGYFNEQLPDIVGIATAPGDNDEAGFLSLTRLLSKPFDSNLVVISGCETALGKRYGSEGLNSLSRGVLAQGAGSVIGTLWPIPDAPTAQFMEVFYDHLERFEGQARLALQQTQIDFAEGLRNDQVDLRWYKHPYFWSAFTLISADQQAESNVFR